MEKILEFILDMVFTSYLFRNYDKKKIRQSLKYISIAIIIFILVIIVYSSL